ncbi:PI-PLC X domain-containing protein 3 isoform X2 [Bicyclus anynana]|nr:PI-PLC X domain-containing protein 3 isoform X2 [Bicyclus anynana]XP_023937237.1 PI-PLC X domain-containing protein 3 isoform X2 [Bicyclus anynana]XP_023937238.1 PI-PLC X domain-containing protein 3 isoform X2 [Bicyclus anynana]
MSDNVSAQHIDLENWMRDLPEPLRNIPLIYLAIPGSHDSMTYGITRNSSLAPDAEPVLKRLYPLFQGTILRWTITQAIDALQQLLIGIRYLDLRLATKTGADQFFFTHGMYAGEISQPLNQVKEFVEQHPHEVVILDFQHFYGFTPDDHQKLIRYILNLFGPKLVPRQPDLNDVTLNTLHRLQQQVVVVYRHSSVLSTGELWLPQMLPSPWPQQDTIRGLLTFLRNVKRNPNMGFVHQAVLTPTPGFIIFRWISSLRQRCAKPVKNEIYPRLSEFSPGRPVDRDGPTPVNVIIADFIEMDDAVFPKSVIQLNMKLLGNLNPITNNYG